MFWKTVLVMGAVAAMVAPAEEVKWTTDLKAAYKQARKTGKYVLISFTGSDWCTACNAQKQGAFNKPQFAEWVNKRFILVEINVPRNAKLVGGEANLMKNQLVCDQFAITTFPTVFVVLGDGTIAGSYSGARILPQHAINELDKLLTIANQISKAKKLQGAERAAALMKIFKSQPEHIRKINAPLMRLIAKADPDDTTGIQKIYEPIRQMNALRVKLSKAKSHSAKLKVLIAAYKKAHPENKAKIKSMLAMQMYQTAYQLSIRAKTVEDIQKAHKLARASLKYFENPDERKALADQIEAYYADPEARLKKVQAKREKKES